MSPRQSYSVGAVRCRGGGGLLYEPPPPLHTLYPPPPPPFHITTRLDRDTIFIIRRTLRQEAFVLWWLLVKSTWLFYTTYALAAWGRRGREGRRGERRRGEGRGEEKGGEEKSIMTGLHQQVEGGGRGTHALWACPQ